MSFCRQTPWIGKLGANWTRSTQSETCKVKTRAAHSQWWRRRRRWYDRPVIELQRARTDGCAVGFDVARTGVASVGFIGFPSVGKSTLMSRLTGQYSEAAAYEFTTLTTVPGQVLYNGAKIQILDLPGIIQGAKDGKGRGRQVIAVAKTCHLIFIVLDVNKPLTDKRVIEQELEGFGIRINKEPPNITFRKKDKGGINITSTVPLSHVDHDVCCPLGQRRMTDLMMWCRKSRPFFLNTESRQRTFPSAVMPPLMISSMFSKQRVERIFLWCMRSTRSTPSPLRSWICSTGFLTPVPSAPNMDGTLTNCSNRCGKS
jgi:small GTP-binding protein